jgi:hypothetical protein
VRTPNHTFLDIAILIDGGINTHADYLKLRRWHEMNMPKRQLEAAAAQ